MGEGGKVWTPWTVLLHKSAFHTSHLFISLFFISFIHIWGQWGKHDQIILLGDYYISKHIL